MSDQSLVFKIPAAATAPALSAGPPVPHLDERTLASDPRADYELAHPHEAVVWRATGSEEPVFLDRTGRRRPLLRLGGVVAALVSTVWLAGVLTGAMGFSSLPGARSTSPAAVAGAPISGVSGHTTRLVAAARRPALDIGRSRRQRDAERGPHPVRV